MQASTMPTADEYPEYFGRYVRLVSEADVLSVLVAEGEATNALLGGLDPERAGHAYAPGKWSIRAVLGHMIDTERVMAGRALHAARGTSAPLPGFDQDRWAEAAGYDDRDLPEMVAEAAIVRASSVSLFQSLGAASAMRRVVADGGEFTARSFAWVIAGHERHHVAILRERYGVG